MTLEQLRIFIVVAERQHITKAAQALHLTQSAVSSAVSTLEGRHGVALFDRVGRNIVLNAAGQIFLEQARRVLGQSAAAERALDDLAGLNRGVLSVQASQTIANYWLPAKLAGFHATYPGIKLDVTMGNSVDVTAAVKAGRVELGLIESEIKDPVLSYAVVDYDQLLLVVGRDHPWARSPPRSVPLAQTAWVLREPGSGTRSAFEAALSRLALKITDLKVAMVLPSNEAVRSAVEAGAGATVISKSVALGGLTAGLLVEVPLELPRRAFHALRHKQRYRSKAGDAFLVSATT